VAGEITIESSGVDNDTTLLFLVAKKTTLDGCGECFRNEILDIRLMRTFGSHLLSPGGRGRVRGNSYQNKKERQGITIPLVFSSSYLFLRPADEFFQQTGEFHRENVLCRGVGADIFEGLEILQCHRLLVDTLGSAEDLLQGLGVTLCP